MALEISLREICSNLTSIRATERKKSAEALKDMLNRTAVPSLLNENTFKKSGYTWSNVFNDIHDYIIKEMEKFETNKHFSAVVGIATSLLNLCVSGSNKGGAYIKCDIIMDACSNIFNDTRHRKAVGDAYLSMLYKHVISNDYFIGYITPEMWENLLDVSISTCLTKISDLDNLTKFKFLLVVIQNASSSSQCLVCLRDSLADLKKCFLTAMHDNKLQDFVMKIVLLLIELLSSECRLYTCEFSEKLLPLLFKIYDHSMDVKKKTLLFKVLHLAITIHHPMGRLQRENGSMAHDWVIWNKQVHSILEIVCLEINYIQKSLKQNINSQAHGEIFSNLAAVTYYQIFNEDNSDVIEEGEHSAKKQRLSFNTKKTFDDLVEEFQQNPETWIGIMYKYVKLFGNALSPSQFFTLLKKSELLVPYNSKTFNWSNFGKMIWMVIDYFVRNPEIPEDINDVFVALWNACVRNSAIPNAAHESIHMIMLSLLRLDIIKYIHVQPLLVFYFEKGMPVDNHTLKTLRFVYFKFFSNCCHLEQRIKCFNWLLHVNMTNIDSELLEELLFQIISNDNVFLPDYKCMELSPHNLYNILFNNLEKSILFGNFEYEMLDYREVTKNTEIFCAIEASREISDLVMNHLQNRLSELSSKIPNKEEAVEHVKYLQVILFLYKSLLKYEIITKEDALCSPLYFVLIEGLKNIFTVLKRVLHSSEQIQGKIALLKYLQVVLENDYNSFLNSVIRSCISEDCFHCIDEILKTEVNYDDEENTYEDDIELSLTGLKHHCLYFLAAYCSHTHDYTDELMKCILDEDIYKFKWHGDIECALRCIKMVTSCDKDNKYLALVFNLMQNMCRVLFRNSKASLGILQTLLLLLDKVWNKNDNVMRQNCVIMVKSYLQRCRKMYYPPHVAVLVYECVARVMELNQKHNIDLDDFLRDVTVEQLKGGIHNMRIYCCYLIKYSFVDHFYIKEVLNTLMDIFVINVSNNEEIILKDETSNRTLTVSHCFLALSQIKPNLIHDIVLEFIHIQKKKGLDKRLIKNVLNIILKKTMNINLDEYVNRNIKNILYFWFQKTNERLEDMPFYLLGFKSIDVFVEKHLKWLIASDILWRNDGHIERSESVKYVVNKTGKSLEDILEVCFCPIIALCLPYIVIEKYKLEDQKTSNSKILLENANRMFQSTRQVLKNEKWSNLFVEHMGELILQAATHFCDPNSAQLEFRVQLHTQRHAFTYSKAVFKAVLRYFGELIDGNIMQYLCENQPLVILNILFKLWTKFVKENIIEWKTLYLYTYISFIENIPMGFPSDVVLFNFACNSVANAIKTSQISDEINILVHSLKVIIEILLNYSSERLDSLKKLLVSKVLSILSIKKERGFTFSNSLSTYLLDYSNFTRDVVDYVDLLYKNEIENHTCSSNEQFSDMLQKYATNLSFPSYEVLSNLRQFLKANNDYVNALVKDLNIKGFSEDCFKSQIHCTINLLNNILKTSNDDKIIIEACNCLSEVCTYDIKSLVTVPPANTENAVTLTPKNYFAYNVLMNLSEELFDDDPTVNGKVAKAINRLLKFRDGHLALDMEGINKQILQPLSPSTSESFSFYQLNDLKFDAYNCLDFWIPKQNEDHSKWIVRITIALLNMIASTNNCAAALSAVCEVKPSLSAKCMPSIFGLLLDCNSEKLFQVISEQINQFFTYIWDMTFDDKLENTEDGAGTRVSSKLDQTHKYIIQCIINVIDFVRLQAKHYKTRQSRSIECLNYLNLDYNKVSWAAALADRSVVAIYYGELFAAASNGGVPPSSPDATAILDGGSHLQLIFRGCFVSIGEMDAVEGCGTAHLTSEEEKRKHLINTSQFADSLLLHDIALSYGAQDRALQYGAVTSLHRSGMHHLALQYIKSCPENEELDNIKYDCLSYLGDWSAFVDTRQLKTKSKLTSNNLNSITKMYRYACLKDSLNIKPTEKFSVKLKQPLDAAKLAISRLCHDLNMENSQCVYKIMANLHLFRDIENYFAVRCGKERLTKLMDDWRIEKLPPFKDFKHLEGLISQRSLILQHAAENNGIHSTIINSLHLQYAELALHNGRVQMAQRIVAMVKRFRPSKEVTLLESEVSWEKGHKDIALSLLHDNITDEEDNVKLTAMSLRQYGLWMAECKRENARDIINKYLEKSLNILKDHDDVKTRLKVYYDIATFADAEYKQVVSYMNSTTFENKVKCLESLKGTAASLKSSQQSLTRDERRVLIANNAFRELDEADIAHTRAEKDNFLNLAMRYYLLSLKQSDENNLSVFRVISLWFENNNIDLDCEETGRLGLLLQSIPSWKFITVLPQIAPRLSSEDNLFAQNLRMLIARCAIEHPHHTLPILFNLKKSDKDESLRGKQGLSGSRAPGAPAPAPEPRVGAAARLIASTAAHTPQLSVTVAQMEAVCDAIINFAYFVPTSKEIGKPLPIPRGESISKLNNLANTPVPTDNIVIRKDLDYSSISSLSSFENHYELVGGINFPKKISCRSSDGKKRILLIKGEDDLRQDAVMQQVFNIVNTLLEKNPVTYHNKLLIRTYKVVAMSRRSGVLEWCEGTMPLGSYLVQAHTKYRPQDIHPSMARNKLKECHENRRSNKHKLAVFNDILRVFKPVFHFFFTEHYLDPVTWYERRVAYTRSVATSSMVGYIMGLGDRHVQNILIDKTTAEVIHIDFGIAFDQGKTLPTPETVPFRLTQDIIAGFGCSGVEGIFRRCCEKTLQLLRDNQETLLTILEVLLCDPLYLWIVPTAAKNASERPRQGESGGGAGLAARALLAVRGKLCGCERGAAAVSVRGHAAALLRRATDRANLCRLFHGWQPYL